RDKSVPTGSFGAVFDDPHNQTSDRRLSADVRYDWAATPALDVTLRGYFDSYAFREGYAYAAEAPGAAPTLNADEDTGRWVGAEAKTVAQLGSGWLLVGGGEAKAHLLQQLRNYDLNGAENLLDRRSSASGSLYAQLEAPLTRWLQAVLGLRYDHVPSVADEVSPRLALLVTPWGGATVKALYGRAFRPPNHSELHYQNPQFWKPPVGLQPERIATYELALEQRLEGGLQFGGTVYRYDVRGLISDVTDPVDGLGTNANVGDVRGTGIEVEAQRRWSNGVGARASWALQRAVDPATGVRLGNSPTSLGKLQLHGPLGFWHLRGGAELLYVGARTTTAGATAAEHLLLGLNLVAAGLASGSLDLSFGVRNALGTSYGDPGYFMQDQVQQDGRSFRASAAWHF
ncbi:MAG TPA: TonB-dependent receptor, partial [Anaeromyxobacteraceae bacterium]